MRRLDTLGPALCQSVLAVLLLTVSAALVPALVMAQPTPVHPELWPTVKSPIPLDPLVERRITDLLARMSIEEKVGQVVQPEWKTIRPEEVVEYHIGSIENGGGAVPGGNKHSSLADWVNLIEPYYQASVSHTRDVKIPLIWASDAVHGHNNVYGATLFPHNIGLGAARDPELLRRIGEVTAAEVRSTGMDWTFAPTIAVVRDDRWGRTYESYSEDPDIVSSYAAAMVAGIQGTGAAFLGPNHVIATAKHFLGDGGTDGGRDQGETSISESELTRLHGAPYVEALKAGTQSVMAPCNSWHGVKMHAQKGLLTDVLKGQMGFDGFIMGDWLAHGQIPGCTNIDRATTFCPVGTPEHRAVAREAVRKSLVLLKNNGRVLPIRSNATVLIAGTGAHDIAMQAGGWTLSWQGADNGPGDFPGATSIYEGLKTQIEAAGGQAWFSPDGTYSVKPDVAIVVFGERPYAEFMGDQADVALHYGNAESLSLLRRLREQGIPVVAVLMSGRPLYVNAHLNAADVFVAAWLPGSEGQGLADVLLARPYRTPARKAGGCGTDGGQKGHTLAGCYEHAGSERIVESSGVSIAGSTPTFV